MEDGEYEERNPLLGDSGGDGDGIGEEKGGKRDRLELLSWGAALLAMTKSNVGVGVLEYPFGFKSGGWLASAAVSLLVSVIALVGMRAIADARHWLVKTTPSRGKNWYMELPELVERTVGSRMSAAVYIAEVVTQLSVVISYMIFITNIFHRMLFETTELPRWAYPIILLPVFSGLSFLPSLKRIAPLAPAGLLLGSLGAVLVIAYGISKSPAGLYVAVRPKGIMTMVGIAFFSSEAINQTVGIHAAMKDPSRFKSVLNTSMAIVFTTYVVFGFVVAYLFGDETSSIITRNMGLDALGNATSICFAIYLVCTFPFQMFPAVNVIEFSLKRRHYSHPLLFYALRFSLTIFCTLVAVVYKDLGHFTDLVGYPCMTFLGVITPSVLMLSIDRTEKHSYLAPSRRIMWMVMGALGLVVGVCGTGFSIVQTAHGERDRLELKASTSSTSST